MKTTGHKTTELRLVLLTVFCLASIAVYAADSSSVNSAPKPATHPVAGTAHTGAAHSAAKKAGNRGAPAHSGSTHYATRGYASHNSHATGANRTKNHQTTYASQHNGSTSRTRRTRPLSGQQRLARLHLQPDRVMAIQQALIREGYLQGDANGQWDSRTRDAMMRYQTMHGFPATGLPEAKALMKLGLGSHPLPPELDHSEVGVTGPTPAPGDLTATHPTPPVSQAVPLALDAPSPESK